MSPGYDKAPNPKPNPNPNQGMKHANKQLAIINNQVAAPHSHDLGAVHVSPWSLFSWYRLELYGACLPMQAIILALSCQVFVVALHHPGISPASEIRVQMSSSLIFWFVANLCFIILATWIRHPSVRAEAYIHKI